MKTIAFSILLVFLALLVSWGMTERAARSLVEGWELRGWLRRDKSRQNARYITSVFQEILSNGQGGQTASNRTNDWEEDPCIPPLRS